MSIDLQKLDYSLKQIRWAIYIFLFSFADKYEILQLLF